MAKLPPHMQANDYEEIDDKLSTEETSANISDFITSKVPGELIDEEECEEEDESATSNPSTITDYHTVIQSIRDLITFVSLNDDTEALQYLTKLCLRFEKSTNSSPVLK